MEDAKKLDEIASRGFAVIPSVLRPPEIAALKSALESAIAEDIARWQDSPFYAADRHMVHNLMLRGRPFAALLEQPVLHAYLSKLLSDTCILYAYQSSSLPAKGTNYSNRIHNDCPRFIPSYITNIGVIFALDDFTPENGATYFLPHSQHLTQAPSEQEFMAGAERAACKAGDIIISNARTWHRGGVNETGRVRHAVTMNVCRSYMRQRFDFPRMVPQEVVQQLGETGRRFLGFNVRMPTSLEEYYVPAEQRLYKANQG